MPSGLLTRTRKRSAPLTVLMVLARTLPEMPGSTGLNGHGDALRRRRLRAGRCCVVRKLTGVPVPVLTTVPRGMSTGAPPILLKTTEPVALSTGFCCVPLVNGDPVFSSVTSTRRPGTIPTSMSLTSRSGSAVMGTATVMDSRPGVTVMVAAGRTLTAKAASRPDHKQRHQHCRRPDEATKAAGRDVRLVVNALLSFAMGRGLSGARDDVAPDARRALPAVRHPVALGR